MQNFEPLVSGKYYHIHNRGINNESLFKEPANYNYFLLLLRRHFSPVGQIVAHTLLESEFHIIVKIHEITAATLHQKRLAPHQAMSNLCNAYTKAINKRFKRHGGLFERPFKRHFLTNQTMLQSSISQIYLLPVLYNLTVAPENYKWNSCFFGLKN